MMSNNAKESAAVRRIRRRLQKHLIKQESIATPDALSAMSKAIKELLERKVKAQVSLKNRTFILFDKNRPPAKDQKATLRLRELVKKDYFPQ